MLGELLNELVDLLEAAVPGEYMVDGCIDEPDDLIYLLEYSGGASDNFSAFRNVQINVRSRSNLTAKRTSWGLYNALRESLSEGSAMLPSGRYLLISFKQTPFLSSRDNTNRTIYTFNINVCSQHDVFNP